MAYHRSIVAVGALAALASVAQADFVGLSVESFVGPGWVENGFAGLTAWRIYAHFSAPDEGLVAVFGAPDNPLTVNSSNGLFHNDALHDSLTAPQNLTGPPTNYWPNQWDSYVTIGVDDSAAGETLLSPGFAVQSSSLAQNFTSTNISWFLSGPGDLNGLAGADGRVLIAQFVVAQGAQINGVLNLHGYLGENWLDEPFDSVPGPGAFALFAIAGLARRRHRHLN